MGSSSAAPSSSFEGNVKNKTCAIEIIYEHKEPHPDATHTISLADGDTLQICRDCAEAFAVSQVVTGTLH